jgi:hypothetical protein
METGKAIYKLLKDSADVGAICADRIYPELAQQDVDTPFVVYTVTDTTPSGTKNATSKLDTSRVELYCVSDDYEQAMSLGIAVRDALDRQSGTINAVQVQSVDFDTSDVQFDPDQRVYVLEQTYDVRIQRTGQAVVYSLSPANSITIEEVDGSPTGLANKLVFSNGTVTIAGNTATITSGGALTVKEVDGAPSDSASTIIVPNGTLSFSGSEATLNLTLDTLDTTGILEQIALQLADDSGVTSSDFSNGLVGDFDQDGVVGSADLIVFLATFGTSLASDATERAARLSAAFSNSDGTPYDFVRSINSTELPDRDGDINLSSSEVPEGTNLYFTDARADARIALATVDNLADTPAGIGTAGQVLAVNSGRTGYEFVNQPTTPDLSDYVQSVNDEAPDETGNVVLTTELVPENTNLYYTDARFDTRYATKTRYHDRYATEAETARSGATANVELYYTARPDGDGIAESATSDTGVTDTINRTLYYATKFDANPDTAADWTEYTTQPADNATFATAKAALLAGLNDTDATAETRGTLPLSLKMVRTTTAAATDLLLDTYTGAAAAYSVRKLDKDYTGYAMKVREDSGDTEADIGFDSNGDLDTAAIATHCGSANGYVVTWYDQSGNANNATQSTSSAQPQIYNGTAVITENGKPAVDTTAGTQMLVANYSVLSSNTYTFKVVSNITASDNIFTLFSDTTLGVRIPRAQASSNTNYLQGFTEDNFYKNGSTVTLTTRRSVLDTYVDGQLLFGFIGSPDANYTMAGVLGVTTGDTAFDTEGKHQEILIWPVDQESAGNRTGIETDINTYFSIF